MTDIDRAFIATNFKGFESEKDFKTYDICRHEFLELLLRIALLQNIRCKQMETNVDAFSTDTCHPVLNFPRKASLTVPFEGEELQLLLPGV